MSQAVSGRVCVAQPQASVCSAACNTHMVVHTAQQGHCVSLELRKRSHDYYVTNSTSLKLCLGKINIVHFLVYSGLQFGAALGLTSVRCFCRPSAIFEEGSFLGKIDSLLLYSGCRGWSVIFRWESVTQ